MGCTSALELAHAGCRVTLIERNAIGMESSWAGAGLLSALLPWQYPDFLNALLQQSRALYPALLQRLQGSGVDVEYTHSGLLVLPPFEASAAQDWAQRYGENVQCVASRNLQPDLALDVQALWMPQVAQVRNPRLMRALHAALLQAGVRIEAQCALQSWEIEHDTVQAVCTSQGRMVADDFVLAAGAWSAELMQDAQRQLPISPVRGQIVLFKAIPGQLRPMLYHDGYYMIPRRDGHILVGSTLEHVGFDKQVTEIARTELMQRAFALLPWLREMPVVAHWAGLRPGSPDNRPIISRHPWLQNLYVNSGHYRYGVTLAPASAQALADIMLNRGSMFDLSALAWPVQE